MMRKFERSLDLRKKVQKLKHGEEKEKPSQKKLSNLLKAVSAKTLQTQQTSVVTLRA